MKKDLLNFRSKAQRSDHLVPAEQQLVIRNGLIAAHTSGVISLEACITQTLELLAILLLMEKILHHLGCF